MAEVIETRVMRIPFAGGMGHPPPEVVAVRCITQDLTYSGDRAVVWLPVECPVDVGDSVWTQGHFAFWTPKSRSCADRQYFRADRGWLWNGKPTGERRRWRERVMTDA